MHKKTIKAAELYGMKYIFMYGQPPAIVRRLTAQSQAEYFFPQTLQSITKPLLAAKPKASCGPQLALQPVV